MSRRQTFEIPGVRHGAPIPMAARVGETFHTSAIMGRDPSTNTLPDDPIKQVEYVFANTHTLLQTAGVADDQVVSVEVLLAGDDLRDEVNKHWTEWFPDPGDGPARHTTVRPLPHGLRVQLQLRADLSGSQ